MLSAYCFSSESTAIWSISACVCEQGQQDARGPIWAIKRFNAHINVEFCSSVKFIKYICKYVNKGSDTAVFQIHNIDVNAPQLNGNEIMHYQISQYISSNEAVWHIFGFPIHERGPAVINLTVHLENSERPPRLVFLSVVIIYSASFLFVHRSRPHISV